MDLAHTGVRASAGTAIYPGKGWAENPLPYFERKRGMTDLIFRLRTSNFSCPGLKVQNVISEIFFSSLWTVQLTLWLQLNV